MKKVFYSEVLDKYFDSERECLAAEQKKKTEDYNKLKSSEQETVSRKQAAKVVEEAEAALSEAYACLRKAEETARKEYEKIVAPAKQRLQEAEQNRCDAVEAFNKKFGVYTKRYTGQEAHDEFMRRLGQIEDLWKIFRI